MWVQMKLYLLWIFSSGFSAQKAFTSKSTPQAWTQRRPAVLAEPEGLDLLRTCSRLSPRVNKRFPQKRPPNGPGLTLPVSSGPGWSVTEHGRFRGI